MVDGIRFALDAAISRLAATRSANQSCDSSTAQGGVSGEYRCVLNAKAYARNLDVMAVIGAWDSFCAEIHKRRTTCRRDPSARVGRSCRRWCEGYLGELDDHVLTCECRLGPVATH
jgi:hypothetical protein